VDHLGILNQSNLPPEFRTTKMGLTMVM